MSTNLELPKIPLWQASAANPTPERLIFLKALMDGDQKAIHLELLKCARDPWYWILNWVLTENAHSTSSTPFEKFPDLAHLYYVTRIWQRERMTAWPKSRQIMMTWIISTLYLHDAMFNASRINFIQSKKEDDSDEVLERAYVVYQKLPLFMRTWQPAKRVDCLLTFKRNRSRLWAIPEGAEHLRGYTGTGLMSDETVYQDDVEKMLAAAGPSLGLGKPNGGRITMLSSAGPSAFQLICFDDFTVKF